MRTCCRQALGALLAALVLAGAPAARAAGRQSIAAFVFPSEGVPAETTATLEAALTRALRRDRRLEAHAPDKLVTELAGDSPEDEMALARELVAEGERTLAARRPTEALPKLRQAVAALERLLPHIPKQELAEAVLAVGVAQGLAGDRRAARATFARLLTWRADQPYDLGRHPPELAPLFDEARGDVGRARRGSIEIVSEPPGAQVFIDGRVVGASPTTAGGLKVGDHYVTFSLDGYRKAVVRATVSPRELRTTRVALVAIPRYVAVRQALEGARATVGKAEASPAMLDLRSLFLLDQVLFAHLRAPRTGRVEVELFLYDLRARRRVGHASATAAVGELDDAVGALCATVMGAATQVAAAALVPPPDPPPPPQPRRPPLVARWWFWGAVAVTAAAVAAPFVLLREAPACPAGRACLDAEF